VVEFSFSFWKLRKPFFAKSLIEKCHISKSRKGLGPPFDAHGLLLVDAENAFNKLNRKVSLENIIKGMSAPIHIPTQQVQYSCHIIY